MNETLVMSKLTWRFHLILVAFSGNLNFKKATFDKPAFLSVQFENKSICSLKDSTFNTLGQFLTEEHFSLKKDTTNFELDEDILSKLSGPSL